MEIKVSDLDEVKRLYDNLLYWDKEKFLKSIINDVSNVYEKEFQEYDLLSLLNEFHSDDILDNLEDFEIREYIRENDTVLTESLLVEKILEEIEFDTISEENINKIKEAIKELEESRNG